MRFGLSFTRLQIWMGIWKPNKIKDAIKEKDFDTEEGHYPFEALSRSFKI